jgi:hypothetical protein
VEAVVVDIGIAAVDVVADIGRGYLLKRSGTLHRNIEKMVST